MHSLVFVLVPSTTKHIKAEIERLLAGSEYDPEKQFQQYKTPCSCIGSKALFDSYRLLESTPEGANLLLKLREARARHDRTSEEEVLVQRFTAARTIEKGHPAYRQPDPECEMCDGTGISMDSRDPRSHWDH